MANTRTPRMNQISDDLVVLGAYPASFAVRAITQERDMLKKHKTTCHVPHHETIEILRRAYTKVLVAIRPIGPAREAFDLVLNEFADAIGESTEAKEYVKRMVKLPVEVKR